MKTNRLPALLTIMIISVALDRFTKDWAVRELKGEGARSYLNDFFRLVYAENTGAFLSMGSGLSDQLRYWVLTILPILVLLYVLYLILFAPDMNKNQIWPPYFALSCTVRYFLVSFHISNAYFWQMTTYPFFVQVTL